MEKRIIILLTIMGLIVLGCEQGITPPDESRTESQEIQDYQTALAKGQHNLVTEYKLKAMARSLAKSLENPEIGQYLQQKISEQFDGDYDLLWQNVKDY